MTEPTPTDTGRTEERSRRGWWTAALVASLALNLLFAGAIGARFFVHERMDRMASTSYLQLVPRKFFIEAGKERRDELFGALKPYRDRFREGQQTSRRLAEGLADAIAASPYDEAKVRAAVDAFGRNGADLIGVGSAAALDMLAKLTPDERARLARLMRERARGGGHR